MRVRLLARVPPRSAPGWVVAVWMVASPWAMTITMVAAEPPAAAVTPADEDRPFADEAADDATDEAAAATENRALERTFDRFTRLVAESRWSDAAALCDEILATPHDLLVRTGAGAAMSLRGETMRRLRGAPRAAREAYDLLFAARAERALAEAIAADDAEAVESVARRWFDTQAGRDAAVIAALTALECGRPAVATAWLDGLLAAPGADDIAPTLRAMRGTAGEHAAGGPGAPTPRTEWRQPRGDPGRNAVVAASRPLLVPRYRVPLARSPGEAGGLQRRRRLFAGRDMPLLPAGTPLVVDGTVLVRDSTGILAVDFETGRRLWHAPVAGSVPAADVAPAVDDATQSSLVACAGRVVAIETAPGNDDDPLNRLPGAGAAANALVARGIADGQPCWRLPRDGDATAQAWYLGPPLVVDDELHVLVEEGGEVRLDVVDAVNGAVRWSQPLATLDDHASLAGPHAAARRRAGLTPALADGVLVCPVGAGAVVAVDVAMRSLLWMSRYPTTAARRPEAPMFGALPFQAPPIVDDRPRLACDGCPVIAGDHVLLAPPDGETLVCLDLRTGEPAWIEAPRGRWLVAGAVDDRLVAIGERGVEAFDLATGRNLWSLPHARAGGRPSGRGILTDRALLLPIDAPAVVEIALADGSVAGRCRGRRGSIPGNLVACRDTVVSYTGETLDLFHQSAPLESLIRAAAAAERPGGAWALRWAGQLAIDRGDVAAGLASLRRGLAPRDGDAGAGPFPDAALGGEILDDAILAGMAHDFAAAVGAWREAGGRGGGDVARAAIDGLLTRGDVAGAWAASRDLLVSSPADRGTLVPDPADPALTVHPDRWLAARLAEIRAGASESLRAEIDAAAAVAVDAAAVDPARALERLEALATRLGGDPAGMDARSRAVDVLTARIASGSDTSGLLALRREFHLLTLADSADPDRRASARAALGRTAGDDWGAWPLGAVVLERSRAGRAPAVDPGARTVPVPVDVADRAVGAGIRLACDVEEGRLVVRDRLGRWLTEPLAPDLADGAPLADPTWWIQLGAGHAASCVGRLLVVRLDGGATAFDLAPAAGGARVVWSRRTTAAEPRDAAAGLLVRSVGGRIPRSAALPLGASIAEADAPAPTGTLRGGRARHSGVLVHDGTTLALLDPCSGTPLWERQPLPQSGELVGDDEFVCLATAGGRDSLVLAMQDGRVVRRTTLPPLRERLGERGRRVVAARPLALEPGGAVAPTVRLDVHDAATGEARPLAEVPGESRGLVVGDDRLVVVDPDGGLVAFDLDRGAEAFRARLDGLPGRPDFLHVLPLADRLLVVVGSRAGDAEEAEREFDDMPLLQQLEHTGATTPPVWGGIWAFDRSTGEPLWPVPVRLDGHCVAMTPPAGLPVIVCSRPVRARHDPGGPRLGLVCLDARTGHALIDEEPVTSREPLMGIEVRGAPAAGTIAVREVGGPGRSVVVRFTGAPVPPRPPYRAARRPAPPSAGPGPLDRARLQLVPDE